MNSNIFIYIIISIDVAVIEFDKTSNISSLNNALNNIDTLVNKYFNYNELLLIINNVIKKYDIKNVLINYLYCPITNILEIIRSTVLLKDNNFIELEKFVCSILPNIQDNNKLLLNNKNHKNYKNKFIKK
jgi:hypothetical protein